MKVIYGIGNNIPHLSNTRHNIGWIFIQQLCQILSLKMVTNNTHFITYSNNTIIAKNNSCINVNGQCLKNILKQHNLKINDVIVVHDELELKTGVIKFKYGGSLKGHNGLKSIYEQFKSKDFYRISIGIGRPDNCLDISEYVLSECDDIIKTKIMIFLSDIHKNTGNILCL